MNETPGDALRRRRDALGMSRDELAAEAGVSPSTIYKYEMGKYPKTLGPRIEATLSRLERGDPQPGHRNGVQRRALDALPDDKGEAVVYHFEDGVRVVFLLPPGETQPPSHADITEMMRKARGG